MKTISVQEITTAIRQLCMDVSYDLPADVEQAKQAAAYMRSQPGVTVEEVTGE